MALGTLNCRAAMVVHVSSSVERSSETLFIVQLASRLHRLRRKKLKQLSYQSSGKLESKDVCQPCIKSDAVSEDETASKVSDPDYTSGSEQSCITAIFVGNTDISKREKCLLSKEKPQRVQKYFTKPSKSQTPTKEVDPQPLTFDIKEIGVSGRKGSLFKLPSSSSSGLRVRNQKKCPNSAILIPQVPNQNQLKDSVGSLSLSHSTNTQSFEVSCNQSPHKVSIKQHHELIKQNHPGPSCPSTMTKIPISKREQNIPSDELWIDGPRFTKLKFDSKTLQHLQQEQWVDGPAMCEPCDEIKRSMIRHWVREHSSSLQLDPGEEQSEVWIDFPETNTSENKVLLYSQLSGANSKRSLATNTKKQFHSIKPTISKDQAQLDCKSNNETYLKSENYSRNVLMDKENSDLFMRSEAKDGMDGLYNFQTHQNNNIFNNQINSKDLTNACLHKEKCSVTAITDSEDRISEFNKSELSDISLSDDENDESAESNELIKALQSLHSVSGDYFETTNPNDLEEETEMQDSSVQVSEEDIFGACKDTSSLFSENPLPEVDQLQFSGRFHPLRVYSEENLRFQNEEQEIIEISEKLESLSLPDEHKSDYDNSHLPLFEPGCGQAFYSDGHRQRNKGEGCFYVRSNALAFKLKRLTELREQSQQIRKKITGLDSEPLKSTKEKWSTMSSWLSRPLTSHTFNQNRTPSDEDLISEDALSVKSEPVEVTTSANPMNQLQLETFYEELHRMYPFPRFISSLVSSPRITKNNEELKEVTLTSTHEQMDETRHNNRFFNLNSEQGVEKLDSFDKHQLLETLSYPDENTMTRLNSIDKDRSHRQDLLANFPRRSESLDTGLSDCHYRNKIYSSQEHKFGEDLSSLGMFSSSYCIQQPFLTKPSPLLTKDISISGDLSLNNSRSLVGQEHHINFDRDSVKNRVHKIRAFHLNNESVEDLNSSSSHKPSQKLHQEFVKELSEDKKIPGKKEIHCNLSAYTCGLLHESRIRRSISSTNCDISKIFTSQRNLRLQSSDQSTMLWNSSFPSPYYKITKAREARCLSDYSGRSDISCQVSENTETNLISKEHHYSGTSSGYESMVRESEGTSCSPEFESEEPGVHHGSIKVNHMKNIFGSYHRSRSAPARAAAVNDSERSQSPSPVSCQPHPIRERSAQQSQNSRTGDEDISCTGLFCCRMMDLY
ncbi:uncharacterized protein LOC111085070 [Limulus polyphemus]|uniref:Uncharacterized protein LOC111085070 n=1 Tax=Limulus polyphemus TaxID=6850 RepID=A0ABM1S2L6_LIMPO|nr:uncharacterized protein LOC111085070 [Limulus polyphemus]